MHLITNIPPRKEEPKWSQNIVIIAIICNTKTVILFPSPSLIYTPVNRPINISAVSKCAEFCTYVQYDHTAFRTYNPYRMINVAAHCEITQKCV